MLQNQKLKGKEGSRVQAMKKIVLQKRSLLQNKFSLLKDSSRARADHLKRQRLHSALRRQRNLEISRLKRTAQRPISIHSTFRTVQLSPKPRVPTATSRYTVSAVTLRTKAKVQSKSLQIRGQKAPDYQIQQRMHLSKQNLIEWLGYQSFTNLDRIFK